MRRHFWLAFALSLAAPTVARAGHAQAAPDMRSVARAVALDYVERGLLSERDGRTLAAESLFTRAIDADRSLLDGYVGLARVLMARRRPEDAQRILEAAQMSALVDDESTARWARAMAQHGFVDSAIRAMESRLETPRTQRVIAELYVANGQIAMALSHARRALELTLQSGATIESERDARRFARALSLLSGELDAVRSPGQGASALRRVLAR